MHEVLKEKLPEVQTLFKKYKVKRAYAFGSVCTPAFTDESDIDFLIAFEDVWIHLCKEKIGGAFIMHFRNL